jgi:uncharacterized Zn-binding protein involved in type VI secretion
MPAAARVGDPTGHPGVISGPGVSTVLIGGQPTAVAGDNHACSWPDPNTPHPPTPLTPGSSSVFIGGQPAARVGDMAGCGAPIVSGDSKVQIGG